MLKKTITYKDFNGETRTEDFYFNVTEAELVRMELLETETDGEGNTVGETFRDRIAAIAKSNKGSEILPEFEAIIRMSIGQKSEDGRFFRKSAEYADDFLSSGAWGVLFLELLSDGNAASDFINNVVQINGPTASASDAAELARRRSEATLQGHKAPAERPVQTVGSGVTPMADQNGSPLFKEPAAPMSDAERAELEELRALKAAARESAEQSFVERPQHETGPGFQQD